MKYIHCERAKDEIDYLLRKQRVCQLDDDELTELDILEHGDIIDYCWGCDEPIFEGDKYIEENDGRCYCTKCKNIQED